ncbi:uncharacterized protein N7469_010998 [Penicillium citrinum]|uniref:Cyanovirin-N domain-containing protein n=2 Tax=Penicillium TaxID=5073 RepID=A0A9W9TGP4_PENCI|nr:uncharacterized protein N7469_010998 [Penicillium citrinum]KAJ5222111.1 hypothetical protein N7469_010998 [Penicillium citrinum]KAJ5597087.1 hypothetical protein N7450_003545 [Penicillium hetheringtonii]KAK5797394.1 hypothetical protein VI817_003685 [Penicillium citrinum]
MSFHQSAASYELEDGHILKAVLHDAEGEEQDAELDLNAYIGNNDGSFEWGGENFADSAQEIELNTEGDEENPILRAKLGNVEGEEVEADLNLAERIGNDNGTLIFLA